MEKVFISHTAGDADWARSFAQALPKGMDPSALPFDVRLRRYLVRGTPEQTAEELSHTLQAA